MNQGSGVERAGDCRRGRASGSARNDSAAARRAVAILAISIIVYRIPAAGREVRPTLDSETRTVPSRFPPADAAEPEGLVFIGGTLEPEWLLDAYRHGIFPWPIVPRLTRMQWWSPDPRAIFELDSFRVSRRLERTCRSDRFTVSTDRDFAGVLSGCATAQSRRRNTWLTREMMAAYQRLFELGRAHSIEVWHEGRLAGGTYGVAIGGLFAGESMFYRVRDASKVALVHLVRHLGDRGYRLFDIQQLTSHTQSLGAIEIPPPRVSPPAERGGRAAGGFRRDRRSAVIRWRRTPWRWLPAAALGATAFAEEPRSRIRWNSDRSGYVESRNSCELHYRCGDKIALDRGAPERLVSAGCRRGNQNAPREDPQRARRFRSHPAEKRAQCQRTPRDRHGGAKTIGRQTTAQQRAKPTTSIWLTTSATPANPATAS